MFPFVILRYQRRRTDDKAVISSRGAVVWASSRLPVNRVLYSARMKGVLDMAGHSALRRLLLAALVVAFPAARQALAEDAVLLSSTAPGYGPGMVVASADHLNLPDGASMTVLFKSGEVLRLAGPFDGTLQPPQAAPAEGGASRLADLFRVQGVDASVIGGTRSIPGRDVDSVTDEVLIDPARSGTYCFSPSSSVWIEQPNDGAAGHDLGRKGSRRALAWPAGSERIEWPADIPIDEGSQFEVIVDGNTRAVITFREMLAEYPTSMARMANGVLLGCRDQFDDPLRRLSRATVPPELWITTDHGRHPSYRKGEPVSLTVTASTDGYLYCVASGRDGSAVSLFPAGAVDGALVHGSVAVTVPSRRQPVGLIASADLSQIKCWLADRNVSPELPSALVSQSASRIPEQVANDLDELFAKIHGSRVAGASVAINAN
jgi:hypothetical protein